MPFSFRSTGSKTSSGQDPISLSTGASRERVLPTPGAADRGANATSAAGWRASAVALLGFVVLAVVHTWPLALSPATLSRNDTADTVLHEWIMAWVAHQIVTNPLHLFDANIFFPERYTLAYSDHLFVQSMLGAPLLWAGASPVLVHNLVLIAGFALSGWTTCLVLRRWTGSWTAGAVSGSLVAFNAFSLTRLAQIQDLHVEFFPLALYALDRFLRTARMRDACAAAGWFVLQALTGTYLMVFSIVALATALAVRAGDWWGARARLVLPKLAVAGVLAGAVLTPFMLPYYFARETVGLGRSLEDTARYSAVWTDYLAAPGRWYFELWGKRFFEGDALFPGVAALLLAATAVAMFGWRHRRVRMLCGIGAVALALSFGPGFPPYRWLYAVFPLLAGIRGAVRFGQIALIALGMLAGFGVATIVSRVPRRAAVAASALLLAAVNLEALRAPLYYSEYRGIPPVYDALEQLDRRAVLAFFPFYASPQFHMNAPFMLVTTRTFHRMLNGYSGFKPASYYAHVEALANFPDALSIAALRAGGVTVVLVDSRNMRRANVDRLSAFPELSLWTSDGNLSIYLLAP
jgi:hypothetical protein